jgi:hypothetical protein
VSSLGLGPAATGLTLAVPDSFGDPVDRPFGALFPIVAETLTGWIFVAPVIRFDGECLGGNTQRFLMEAALLNRSTEQVQRRFQTQCLSTIIHVRLFVRAPKSADAEKRKTRRYGGSARPTTVMQPSLTLTHTHTSTHTHTHT